MHKKNCVVHLLLILAVLTGMLMMTGCQATTREFDPTDTIHYDASYDFSDKNKIVNALVESLSHRSPLAARKDRPVVIVYNVANRTNEHISTDLITDDIRQRILETGKARFVNKVQRENIEKELSYQYGGNVSPETRTQRARQIGAEYMISGTLRSITKKEPSQIRLKKRKLQYYSLTLELTDLESGLVEWADSVEIVREEARPIIGW
jgi:penicillin-binding protein activator